MGFGTMYSNIGPSVEVHLVSHILVMQFIMASDVNICDKVIW